ncbi:Syd protein [Streptomyces sp. NBRC 110611]|uniref:hypothetical protein n=1 Tax=Streptomyces sp. NBRC 110611 TaxID=1621259 RepID=UPI00082D863B|nr:hypothetical protein [Streptomyces sp. NBRC 110611]GAU69729.1 Syd protein [Streptomyces sp. NBRC 110611]
MDPLSFPVLTGAALTQAFTFLYGRLSAALDRRAEARDRVAVPDVLQGELRFPLSPDELEVTNREEALIAMRDALEVFNDQGQGHLLDGSNEGVRRSLARLRGALEAVYGQRITFAGEERPATGSPVVDQRLGTVRGKVTGMDADEVSGRAQVIQDARTVEADAEVVGIKSKRIIGG